MKKTAIAFAFAGAMLASAPAVYATPIAPDSQISFVGGVRPIGSTSTRDATGLDFANSGQFDTAPNYTGGTINLNSDGTGTFSVFTQAGCPAAASAGGCGTIKDLPNFSTFTATSPFYTITEGSNTLSFNLLAITSIERSASTAAGGSITIFGTGTFILAGYDPTPGEFVLSAQGNSRTTFSASTVAGAIPEPATIALIGAGLVATGLVRRRRSM